MKLNAEEWMADRKKADLGLSAAAVHTKSLEAELVRTQQVLERIAAQGNECFSAELGDVRAQLSELAAIAVEREALRQAADAQGANIGFLRNQMLEMARQVALLRQRPSAHEISSAAKREPRPEPAPSATLELVAAV